MKKKCRMRRMESMKVGALDFVQVVEKRKEKAYSLGFQEASLSFVRSILAQYRQDISYFLFWKCLRKKEVKCISSLFLQHFKHKSANILISSDFYFYSNNNPNNTMKREYVLQARGRHKDVIKSEWEDKWMDTKRARLNQACGRTNRSDYRQQIEWRRDRMGDVNDNGRLVVQVQM